MAQIPRYQRQLNINISADLPFRYTDPQVARSVDVAGSRIARGMDEWADFAHKAAKVEQFSRANETISDFKIQQNDFERDLKEAYSDNPKEYYQAWNDGMKARIDEALGTVSGIAREKVGLELNNYHAGTSRGAMDWSTRAWFDSEIASADKTLQLAVSSASLEVDDWRSSDRMQSALDHIDELEMLGIMPKREATAKKFNAFQSFQHARAKLEIHKPSIEGQSGPLMFLEKLKGGEYDYLTPQQSTALMLEAERVEKSRINDMDGASKKLKEKQDEEQKALQERALNEFFNLTTAIRKMDPRDYNVADEVAKASKLIDHALNARIIEKASDARMLKQLLIQKVEDEESNTPAYRDYWDAIIRGKDIDPLAVARDIAMRKLTPTAGEEIMSNKFKYHFTRDPNYQAAVNMIEQAFSISGQVIYSSLKGAERTDRELRMANALRTLWENARLAPEGKSLNHVEVAHRIIKNQLEYIGAEWITGAAPVGEVPVGKKPPAGLKVVDELVDLDEDEERKKALEKIQSR